VAEPTFLEQAKTFFVMVEELGISGDAKNKPERN
jgi:hypothetical protein|tara:strand:+ start:186 stop:287 length:102 start_codon:yes stop_codon:yes gene_type:complete